MVCIGSHSDVLLVGAGPAGLALGAELGRRGVAVTVVDRDLGKPWARSFGSWARTLPPDLVSEAAVARFDAPLVTFAAGDQRALPHSYVRFDTGRLQAALSARARDVGVVLVQGHVERAHAEGPRMRAELRFGDGEQRSLCARLIVNASGGALGRKKLDKSAPAFQSAFGAWLQVSRMPWGSGDMSLMDLRRGPAKGEQDCPPSFLYAMPERPGVLFAQETVLASRRPASMKALQARLWTRLSRLGVEVDHTLATERCLIPLGAQPKDQGSEILDFGAAASMVQPSSGYCLARIVGAAPGLAEVLASELKAPESRPHRLAERGRQAVWPTDARRAFALYRLGLQTLLGFDQDEADAFWRAFFELPGDTAQRFMSGTLAAREVTTAMLRVFFDVPLRLRLELLRGGARFLSHTTTRGPS